MTLGLFDLGHRATALDRAASRWDDVAASVATVRADVSRNSRRVLGRGWEGVAADSFDTHRGELVRSLNRAHDLALGHASALRLSAGSVRAAQGRLDTAWATVAAVDHQGDGAGGVVFHPADPAEQTLVDEALGEAHEIRDGLDRDLDVDATSIRTAAADWRRMSTRWEAVADGTQDAFEVPNEDEATGIIVDGNRTILHTGRGHEVIATSRATDGGTLVTVDGQYYRVPPGQELVIHSGSGADQIWTGQAASTVIAGGGDDRVHGSADDEVIFGLGGRDQIDAGDGDDYVSGGTGREADEGDASNADYLSGQGGDDFLLGGDDDDVIYGLEGRDVVLGGEGDDYLEGGTDDDVLQGGAHSDVLSGGRDDDEGYGGGSSDTWYAGLGHDHFDGGGATDRSYDEVGDESVDTESAETVTIATDLPDIDVQPTVEMEEERIQADLDLLASSPTGQRLFDALSEAQDEHGGTVILTSGEHNTASPQEDPVVRMNPHTSFAPPTAILAHELNHAYDYLTDNFDGDEYDGVDAEDHGIRNGERVAAGLEIDHDDDPDTPEIIDPDHPWEITENAIRTEMGWPTRQHYT